MALQGDPQDEAVRVREAFGEDFDAAKLTLAGVAAAEKAKQRTRDRFELAKAALTGLLANIRWLEMNDEHTVLSAIALADLMLAELEKAVP